jgi:hypothetical protein
MGKRNPLALSVGAAFLPRCCRGQGDKINTVQGLYALAHAAQLQLKKSSLPYHKDWTILASDAQ